MALQVILLSPGLRTCFLAAQRPEGVTVFTSCYPLQQKKAEEGAEEQIEEHGLKTGAGREGTVPRWSKDG